MEFLFSNPLIEWIFGVVSFVGVVLLGWSNLRVEPPASTGVIHKELSVWERHKLRQAGKHRQSVEYSVQKAH